MNGIKGSITSNPDFITAARMGWVSRTHLLCAVEREGKTESVCPPALWCSRAQVLKQQKAETGLG